MTLKKEDDLKIEDILKNKNDTKYQPSGEGCTCSMPVTPHHLQNPKWPLGGAKKTDRVWKGVYP